MIRGEGKTKIKIAKTKQLVTNQNNLWWMLSIIDTAENNYKYIRIRNHSGHRQKQTSSLKTTWRGGGDNKLKKKRKMASLRHVIIIKIENSIIG